MEHGNSNMRKLTAARVVSDLDFQVGIRQCHCTALDEVLLKGSGYFTKT